MQDMQKEPIAIIGIGCRFPGAENPAAYWKLLCEGRSALREVPADRWDIDAFYDHDLNTPGKMTSRWGGFLDQIDQFDWRTFRIPPHEAKYIDPQHRLLLEVAWEALEDAGIPFETIAGSHTGVFIGISWNDYLRLQVRDRSQISSHTATGGSLLFASNRLSYFFDLHGPSFSIDVGCISSLASLQLACQHLWQSTDEIALAGGVNLILSPDISIMTSRAGLLASDGKCKALDAHADGFVRGEGAGVLILKRLSQVQASDRVYALIHAATLNHNGHNEWITAPSQSAQEHLLAEAYRQANLDPALVDYVELHGTGFLKGDRTEAMALGTVLGSSPTRPRSCLVGSAKTNIGHLEAASGVASLIKVTLSLYHQQIPPTLHLEEINPDIPLQQLRLEPALALSDWPQKAKDTPLLAGVTGIAMSGANAHVVLSGPPSPIGITKSPKGIQQQLFLSATSPQSLLAQIKAWRAFLYENVQTNASSWQDICYTASMRRSHHPYQLLVSGQTALEAAAALDDFLLREDALQEIMAQHKVYSGRQQEHLSINEGRCVSLPPYSWHRERLWFDTAQQADSSTPVPPINCETTEEETPLKKRLLELPRPKRKAALQEYLTAYISSVLEPEPTEPLAPTQSLFDVGMKSLTATRIINHIRTVLGYSLPLTLVFNYPTIERFCEYLVNQGESEPQASPDEPRKREIVTAPFKEPNALSEQEMVASLLTRLAQIERKLS